MVLQSITKRPRACLGRGTGTGDTVAEHPVGLGRITAVDAAIDRAATSWSSRGGRRRRWNANE